MVRSISIVYVVSFHLMLHYSIYCCVVANSISAPDTYVACVHVLFVSTNQPMTNSFLGDFPLPLSYNYSHDAPFSRFHGERPKRNCRDYELNSKRFLIEKGNTELPTKNDPNANGFVWGDYVGLPCVSISPFTWKIVSFFEPFQAFFETDQAHKQQGVLQSPTVITFLLEKAWRYELYIEPTKILASPT